MSDEQFSLDVDVGRAALSVHTSAPQRFSCPCVCVRTPRRRDSRFELAWALRAAAASEDCRAVAGTKRLSNATAGCETAHTWRLKAIDQCWNGKTKDEASAAPQSRFFWWISYKLTMEPRRGAKLPAFTPLWSNEGSGTGLIAPHLRWRRVKFAPMKFYLSWLICVAVRASRAARHP